MNSFLFRETCLYASDPVFFLSVLSSLLHFIFISGDVLCYSFYLHWWSDESQKAANRHSFQFSTACSIIIVCSSDK